MSSAVAIAATPSSRPVRPSPSVVVARDAHRGADGPAQHLLDLGPPGADLRTVADHLDGHVGDVEAGRATRRTVSASRTTPAAPAHSGSAVPKSLPRSPSPAADSSASQAACAANREIVEQFISDRLVAAGADKGRAEIAAAEMRRDHHVGRLDFERRVEDLVIAIELAVRVITAVAQHLPLVVVAEIRKRHVVDLQIAAAGVIERRDRFAIGLRKVGIIVVEVGVDLLATTLRPPR